MLLLLTPAQKRKKRRFDGESWRLLEVVEVSSSCPIAIGEEFRKCTMLVLEITCCNVTISNCSYYVVVVVVVATKPATVLSFAGAGTTISRTSNSIALYETTIRTRGTMPATTRQPVRVPPTTLMSTSLVCWMIREWS